MLLEIKKIIYSGTPLEYTLSIVYLLFSSITTLDLRITKAKKLGILTKDEANLPKWVIAFYWINWILLGIVAIINWKYALILYAVKLILAILPILEIIGNIIMSPFKK